MLRNKVYTLINIVGLAVGMAACILILLFVKDELSFDTYHENSDRIYRVSREWFNRDGESSLHLGHVAPPFGPLIKQDFEGIVEEMIRFRSGYDPLMTYEDKQFEEERFFFVDGQVFDMFSWEMIAGDPSTALVEPYTLVLTASTVQKYFGAEASPEDAIGKVLNFNQQGDLKITGVVKDVPLNSHFKYDMLGSFATLENFIGIDRLMTSFGSNNYGTYLLLKEGYNPKDLEAQFPELLDRHMGNPSSTRQPSQGTQLHLWPLTDIHLHSHLDSEIEANSQISFVYIFSIIAIFVLLIACFNFINLSTAQASRRAKEVGLRKVVGAFRSHLIRQFMSESLLISIIALGLAVILVELCLPLFNDFVGRGLEMDYFGDSFYLSLLAGIALLSGIVAGSYPALYLSSFKPITILRNHSHTSSGGSSPLRSTLVVMQFAISISLIIGLGVVNDQLDFVRNKSLGFDKENLVVLPLNNEIYERYDHVKERLLNHPGITQVSMASRVPSGRLLDSQGGKFEKINGADGSTSMENITFRLADVHVGHDYLNTLGVKFVAGRNFDARLASDSSESFILNARALDNLGYTDPEIAIGKKLQYGGRSGKIIGITEDFHFENLHQSIVPIIFMVTNGRSNSVLVRVNRAATSEVMAYLEEEWKVLRPGFPFTPFSVEDQYWEQYENEEKVGKLVQNFSLLAVIIAALGLFGLASFTAARRFKEIGIRKVLGASTSQIMVLLTKGFTILVILGFLVAIPIAWFGMNAWLEDNFAYHITLSPWPFVMAGAAALLLAWFTVAWQSLKAASSNPVEALRQE